MQCPAVLLLALLYICNHGGAGFPAKKQASREGKEFHKNLAFWRALEGFVADRSSGQGCLL